MAMSLKAARQISGLTQKEMAEKMGICRHTYMKYEKEPNQIPIGAAKAISKITGVGIDEIFFGHKST